MDVEATPISIGGPGATLISAHPSDSPPRPDTVALIGALGGRPFLQRSEQGAGAAIFLDEESVEASRWLTGKGQIRVDALRIGFEARGQEWFLRTESLSESRPSRGHDGSEADRDKAAHADERELISPLPYNGREPEASPSAPTPIRRPLLAWAFSALALASALIFFFLMRSIGIVFTPAADQIDLDGGSSVSFAGRHWLRPGSFTLRAQKPGYEPFETRIEVEGHENFRFSLIPLPGQLSVKTNPVSNATLWIDSKEVGQTPLDRWSLKQGEYRIRASAPLHRVAEKIITIEGLGQEQTLVLHLEPAWAEISVVSIPEGAEISLDGEAIGFTPATLRSGEGERELTLRHPGFKPWNKSLDVVAQRPLEIGPIELIRAPEPKPAAASQEISVSPSPPADAATAKSHPKRIETRNGSVLLLAPVGDFKMGTPRGQQGRRSNERERAVRLERPFYLGTHEVTNAQFAAFRKTHDSGYLRSISLRGGDQPVVSVSWQDAAAYCNWLSAQENLPPAYVMQGGELKPVLPMTTGYRLPTEAEWSRVAQTDASHRYPWGSSFPPGPGTGNFADRAGESLFETTLPGFEDGHPITAPVGRYAPNALGFFDLAGNASEWVHDIYSARGASGTDPLGPELGTQHVVRGSSFRHSSITSLRTAWRDPAREGRIDLGFRIARYAE